MGRGTDWILPGAAIAGLSLTCSFLLSAATEYPGRPKGLTSLTVALSVIIVAALFRFLRYLYGMWKAGVPDPIARIVGDVRPALADFVPIATGVAVIGTFLFGVTFLKSMLVAVVPFWADEPLAAIDRTLSIYPQQIAESLGPLLPPIGIFYGLWHAANLGGILWVLHWRTEARSRFIISFMLTWAIGMATAYAFSSAGPIFTGEFDPAVAPESVRKPAAILWANYQAKGALLGGGISAFPSMHVAIAAWFALALKERGLGWVGIVYAAAIFFCSIVLGWHYSLDGVAGIAIALVAQRISNNWFAKRRLAEVPLGTLPSAAT
jgi:hypothetical protein